MVGGGRDTCIPLCTLLLPFPTTMGAPSISGRVGLGLGKGVPLDSQILLWGCCTPSADSARGGGGGMATPGDAHDLLSLLLPLPTISLVHGVR